MQFVSQLCRQGEGGETGNDENVLIRNKPSDRDSMSIANLLTHVGDGCVIDMGDGEVQGGVPRNVPLR